MPKLSNAQLLADRQGRAVDALLGKARRIVKQIRVAESAGEERMGQLLDLAPKFAPLNASGDAMAEFWGLVQLGQQQLEALCSSERVRVSEEGAEALDSKSMGQGAVL